LHCVALDEQVVKVTHLVSESLNSLKLEVDFESVKQVLSDSSVNFNGIDFNSLRVSFGDLLDFHSSLKRSNNCGSLAVSVQNESKIDLSDDINSFVDQDSVDFESVFSGLMGHQVVTNHFGCEFLDLLRSFEDLDSSLQAATEGSLSSASSVHLSFENEIAFSDVEVSGNLFGLFGSGGNVSALDENTVFAHKIFALVLMEVKESADGGGEGFAEEGSEDLGDHKIYSEYQ
jgi:hypothetical protein